MLGLGVMDAASHNQIITEIAKFMNIYSRRKVRYSFTKLEKITYMVCFVA